jgi:hypothetical protein
MKTACNCKKHVKIEYKVNWGLELKMGQQTQIHVFTFVPDLKQQWKNMEKNLSRDLL